MKSSVLELLPTQMPGCFTCPFGLLLAALAFPLFKGASKDRVPWYDWALAALGVLSCLYIVWFRNEIAVRAGLPTTGDLVVSTIGMIILFVTVYRVLGLPLMIVAGCFCALCLFWRCPLVAGCHCSGRVRLMARRCGISGCRMKGCSALLLEVSASLIFLFVLFWVGVGKSRSGQLFH